MRIKKRKKIGLILKLTVLSSPGSIQLSLSQAKADPSIAWARFMSLSPFTLIMYPIFCFINNCTWTRLTGAVPQPLIVIVRCCRLLYFLCPMLLSCLVGVVILFKNIPRVFLGPARLWQRWNKLTEWSHTQDSCGISYEWSTTLLAWMLFSIGSFHKISIGPLSVWVQIVQDLTNLTTHVN